MHPALVEDLARWADVQSLSFRASEMDVTFRSNLAKRYLGLAVGMYKLVKVTSDPSHLFGLTTASAAKEVSRSSGYMTPPSTVPQETAYCDRIRSTPSGIYIRLMSLSNADADMSLSPELPVLHPGIPSMRPENSSLREEGGGGSEDIPDNTVILEMGDDDLQEQDYGMHDHDTESEQQAEADINYGANYMGSDDEN